MKTIPIIEEMFDEMIAATDALEKAINDPNNDAESLKKFNDAKMEMVKIGSHLGIWFRCIKQREEREEKGGV